MTLKELNDDEEYELDSIKGRAGAKKKMAVLNKGKITKQELDELFLREDKDEDV